MEKIVLDEVKEMMSHFGKVLRIINQGRAFESENNLNECINKCKRLQVELMNSIKLIEWTFMEIQKAEQTQLALNSESDDEK